MSHAPKDEKFAGWLDLYVMLVYSLPMPINSVGKIGNGPGVYALVAFLPGNAP
jgi:hypothetical protein